MIQSFNWLENMSKKLLVSNGVTDWDWNCVIDPDISVILY